MAQAPKTTLTQESFDSLHRWNKWLAGFHAVQGAAIVVLSSHADLPVTASYLTPDPVQSTLAGHPVLGSATHQLFVINLGYLVALFFFLSAIAHLAIATVWRKGYEADLKKGLNRARWIEYAASAGVMMVAIGLLSGVYDASTLLMLLALTAGMNLLGLVMEITNQGKKTTSWLAYWVGAGVGIVPWLVIAAYLIGANVYGTGRIPGFVYWIYGTIFLSFGSFAANMALQYRKKGKWSTYLYGERLYMLLSLVAKTALAWQVFAGTLRP